MCRPGTPPSADRRHRTATFDPPKPPKQEPDDGSAPAETASSDRPSYPEAERRELPVQVDRRIPRGTIALTGARIVTMAGEDGGVLEDGTIVIEDNRVAAVGSSGQVSIPDGARSIDLSGHTIVPGFIDTHAHWTEIRRGVLDTDAWTFLANLAYGVTVGLDVQT